LLEVVCVLAIIALLAAVLLPRIPDGTSRPRLEAYALDAASVLKADRSAAIRRRVEVVSDVNAPARFIRSGATGRIVRIPNDVVFDAVLPERCNQRPAFSAISFFRLAENGVIPAFRVGTSLRMPLESCFSQTTYL